MAYPLLKKRIETKKARIGVVGLGYVGLPLAVAFARAGFSVTGIDVDAQKVHRLNRGHSYVLDVSSEDVRELVGKKRLHATCDTQAIAGLDVIVICVPTPLGKTKEPDLSYVIEAAERIGSRLKRGQLVVLESTTYPGTTEEVVLPTLSKASGLKVEKDFFLAFSPERVDPGNKSFDLTAIPKVVGGIGKISSQMTKILYGMIMQKVVLVSSAKAAEMTKLLENTFRSVNIGLINEIAILSNRLGIDIWEVIEAAKTKPFGFMPFYPGPGIGGHCLPIDPLYLSWKSRIHGYEAKMIELASLINQAMPEYVVERVLHLLNQRQMALKGSAVLVLGVSYKKDVDDLRESPALDVMTLLAKEGAEVHYSDPFVASLKIGSKNYTSQKLTPAFVRRHKAVLILTDHRLFDYKMIVRQARLVLDTRNALRSMAPRPNLFFL